MAQYPHDKLYAFSEVTEEDKQNFEKLRAKLRDAGLGMNITIHENMDYFIQQTKRLENNIDVPLNW
ncbi:hypothetical protein DRW41_00155 [Neobacillus piezotolerans]|uniref:Uncharacterized protein n=1 Tax=Neobacillus piezotolerans TaxID=2259171 RepID=A0A3D8GUE2_9BACI|nr:hypothetical protein [Neobacillus piezotolerans]RDU38027.1 hypothetical protein DRW41_00155 [Neobacillus piezotolerans]